jgi:hypothetical protein
MGSVMFGLIITNALYLWVLSRDDNEDETVAYQMPDGAVAVVDEATGAVTYVDAGKASSFLADQSSFQVSSTGVVVLWTVGSAVHAIFDSFLWYALSCSCCPACQDSGDGEGEGKSWLARNRKYCNVLVVIAVILIAATATLGVVIRAFIEGNENEQDAADALSSSVQTDGSGQPNGAEPLSNKDNYEFLKVYAIELVLSWFAFFPVIETLLFSGILSCGGRISCLGGRPAELREEEKQKEKERKRELAVAYAKQADEKARSRASNASSATSSKKKKKKKSATNKPQKSGKKKKVPPIS